MVYWTASPLAASTNVVGPKLIELVSIIHIAQLVIIYLYHKHQNKPNYLFLAAKILRQKLGINSILQNH